MYACSPSWKTDWISEKDSEKILAQLAGKIRGSPLGSDRIGINYGLHFTGGEPFLNYRLLLKIVETAHRLEIPSIFVETNCFWCGDDNTTRERLVQLKNVGLHGIMISVNPFILEYVPPRRTKRAIRIGKEVFGENAIVYQESFYRQFRRFNIEDILPFEEYIQRNGLSSLSRMELLPMGRAVYSLGGFFEKYPAKLFFSESCVTELTRDWHVHVDNYGNYIAGYCGGISLGDARDLNSICGGIDLDDKPVIAALATNIGRLFELGKQFGYEERGEGYISKCHLCVDIRRHLVQQTDKINELAPQEFYRHLQ